MKNEELVTVCREKSTNKYYLVRGECKDLFDSNTYLVIRRNNTDEYLRKDLFDDIGPSTYKHFKWLKECGK